MPTTRRSPNDPPSADISALRALAADLTAQGAAPAQLCAACLNAPLPGDALILEQLWIEHDMDQHAALLLPWMLWSAARPPNTRDDELDALIAAWPEHLPALVVHQASLVSARALYGWRRDTLHERAPALWRLTADQALAAAGADLWSSLTSIMGALHERYTLLAHRERRRGDGSADRACDQLAGLLDAIAV